MSLLNFFKSKKKVNVEKDAFIEEKDPEDVLRTTSLNEGAKNITAIYAFLQADYESKGYNDALTNPDDSYRSDNIKLIKHDLNILIEKVNTYYNDAIRELDFHISSRTRAGLIDLVEELKSKKEIALEHMVKVKQISDDRENETGMSQRIFLSYQKGFMRGLSAITQSKIFGKKL